MIEELSKSFDLTEEEITAIIDSDSYQRWVAHAESSANWCHWCLKTLYPVEGVTIPDKFRLFVLVYLRYDYEGVRPREREVQFVLWLIDTQYSGKGLVMSRLLKGYAENHRVLLLDVAKRHFKNSSIYADLIRLFSLPKKKDDTITTKILEAMPTMKNGLCAENFCEVGATGCVWTGKGVEFWFFCNCVKNIFMGENASQIPWATIESEFEFRGFTPNSARHLKDRAEFMKASTKKTIAAIVRGAFHIR